MTGLQKVTLNNLHSTDSVLATMAKDAKIANDEETLRKLAIHPGAGSETLKIISEGYVMSKTEFQEIALNNPNSPDDILAKIAEEAKSSNDEETLRKLAIHPRAGAKTLEVLYN